MKITYSKASDILAATGNDLSDLDGDLALEIVEMEIVIEDAFRANTKRVITLNRELQSIKGKEKEERTREDLDRVVAIADEIESIYEKERQVKVPKFPFGDGSDRDLKPHLSLSGIRAFRPLLDIHKGGDS